MIAYLALRSTLHNNPQSCRRLSARRKHSHLRSTRTYLRVSKPITASRIPLTPKTTVRLVSPASESPIAASQQMRLPRILPRPSRSEVDASTIAAASPELEHVSPEYIREKLALITPQYVFFFSNCNV